MNVSNSERLPRRAVWMFHLCTKLRYILFVGVLTFPRGSLHIWSLFAQNKSKQSEATSSHNTLAREQWQTYRHTVNGRRLSFEVLNNKRVQAKCRLIPPHGATAPPRGPGLPHYRCSTITLRHTTLGGNHLDKWSASTWQNSQGSNIHAPGGIRTHCSE